MNLELQQEANSKLAFFDEPAFFFKPDPDPHLSEKLDPDPHQLADEKPKCNMRLFEHFFEVLSLYVEARTRIRIRINVKGWIRPTKIEKSS